MADQHIITALGSAAGTLCRQEVLQLISRCGNIQEVMDS